MLERVHRKILRTIQGLPVRCPSVVLTTLLGSRDISSFISQQQLTFSNPITSMSTTDLPRLILERLTNPPLSGIIPLWQQLLDNQREEASKLSGTLLSGLTSKSCQLERLTALLSHGSSVLSAIQVVGEQQRLLAENEEDNEELLAMFVDRQSSHLELLLHRAREQLVVAEREERETKLAMNKTKEEVWENR